MDLKTHAMGAAVRPAKVAKIASDFCLCHTQGVSGALTDFRAKSWATLWRAAEIRKDKTFIFLRDNADVNVPRGGYHRTCYHCGATLTESISSEL